jgi:hypothetical protein
MKINSETHFPHPVLSSQTTDYKKGSFSLSLTIEEVPATGKLKIDYSVKLDETGLLGHVRAGSAVIGMFITCLDTFYNRIMVLEHQNGSIEFPAGILRGRCTIRPLVCAAEEITGYTNANLNDEYAGHTWEFRNGSVLAIGTELVINVGHEKLAPMESIFKLAENEELEEGEISVQTDSESITIHCSKSAFVTVHGLRQSARGKLVLLNSIFLPVVMEVLSHLRDNAASFADKKWFKVFNAKCEHLGIVYANGNFLEDAQKLLKSPISKLKAVGEDL